MYSFIHSHETVDTARTTANKQRNERTIGVRLNNMFICAWFASEFQVLIDERTMFTWQIEQLEDN